MKFVIWTGILSIVLSALVVVNIVAVVMYNRAYYAMHKTLMIQSVYFLLVALLFEHMHFAMISLALFFDNTAFAMKLMHPGYMIVIQSCVVVAGIFFVYASLSPTKYYKEELTN